MNSADPMTTAYAALARRAWDTNRGRAAELTALVADWRRAGVLTAAQQEHGRAVAHSLRGSAGTFGHEAAADAAGELQELFIADLRPGLDVAAELVDRIDRALAEPPRLEL